MMDSFAPYIRIILRYGAGAGLFGSTALGDKLASDPDIIFIVSAGIAVAVELWYAIRKKFGGVT